MREIGKTLIVAIFLLIEVVHAKIPNNSFKADFLETNVEIISGNYNTTRFLLGNDAIVDVRNDIHLRLNQNPYKIKSHEKFIILAPITAVEIIKGVLPQQYIKRYPLSYYIRLRNKYEEEYGI